MSLYSYMSLQSEEIGQIMAVSPLFLLAPKIDVFHQRHSIEYTVVKGGLPMSEQNISHLDSPFLPSFIQMMPSLIYLEQLGQIMALQAFAFMRKRTGHRCGNQDITLRKRYIYIYIFINIISFQSLDLSLQMDVQTVRQRQP